MSHPEADDLERFRALMRDFDRMDLKTERFRDVYCDHLTEMIDLGIGGPFYAIASNGHCDYMFTESRISGVRHADSFLEWCLAVANEYRKIAQGQEPQDALEREDRAVLLRQADLIEELSYLAHAMLKKRSSGSSGAKGA